ncbi:MAG TPA: glutaredoxin family protein [Beutenbergiaceae bacterium]|nr:glutaredoxin family protein [Beutenbergiaceae bacterium]
MKIDFYTRPGCTLCDQGRVIVQRVCGSRPWNEINIDDDPQLQERYGEYVPVVEVNGERVGQWRIDETRLRHAIEGKPRRWRFLRGKRAL